MAKKEEVKKKKKAPAPKADKPKVEKEEEEEEDANLGSDVEETEEDEDAPEEEVDEDEGEDEDGDGEADKLPVRVQEVEIAGKKAYFRLCFIANLVDKKGKLLKIAGFNERGQRISPWLDVTAGPEQKGDLAPSKKIARDVARMNALRRQKMLPEDFERQAPVGSVVVAE